RDPRRDAARNGAAGRGRARAAREGDQRRGRVPGLRAPQGCGTRDRGSPDRAPASVPPNPARARGVAGDDDRVSGADRSRRTVPRAQRELRELTGELRRDAATGRWVAVAAERALRPGATRNRVEPPTAEE